MCVAVIIVQLRDTYIYPSPSREIDPAKRRDAQTKVMKWAEKQITDDEFKMSLDEEQAIDVMDNDRYYEGIVDEYVKAEFYDLFFFRSDARFPPDSYGP